MDGPPQPYIPPKDRTNKGTSSHWRIKNWNKVCHKPPPKTMPSKDSIHSTQHHSKERSHHVQSPTQKHNKHIGSQDTNVQDGTRHISAYLSIPEVSSYTPLLTTTTNSIMVQLEYQRKNEGWQYRRGNPTREQRTVEAEALQGKVIPPDSMQH